MLEKRDQTKIESVHFQGSLVSFSNLCITKALFRLFGSAVFYFDFLEEKLLEKQDTQNVAELIKRLDVVSRNSQSNPSLQVGSKFAAKACCKLEIVLLGLILF